MKTLEKIDLYKLHKADYTTAKKPVLLNIPPTTYLAISGQGAPGGEAFTASIGALYGVAFTVKMTRKFAGLPDYAVCKLEGQWWSPAAQNFASVPREQWCWKLLIRTPEFVTQTDLEKAAAVLLKRGKEPEVKRVQLEVLTEGLCVQMLHVGPYERECETIAIMRDFAARNQLLFQGRHHEVYLSDPRRVAAERLRTILRQPLEKAVG